MWQQGALGATYQVARLFQSISLIAIIGLTANFISEIVAVNGEPPSILIGTLTVTCIVVIYCIITFILLLDTILPYLAAAIADTLCLIAVIVVAVIIGKPLSYLKCEEIGRGGDGDGDDSSAYAFATHLDSYLAHLGKKIEYGSLIGASKAVCLEAKSIWGLSIALCIMFFFSAVCLVCLWKQKKGPGGKEDV
ncbi:uncharacterized protein BDW47DRAFT_106860 [Aspergillus candidus]|uniref:MARVEL domain-containing protein n=1 Tax=Aspergillus candidus TaxID=41067 RepID=A0A2I2FAD0_ASPCN|nr:hypothetical protein BDW47DRAFT_106860 [Aspergillus candidus]PLB37582.1 hypothetical protein BDW47DRAFT_106860 [Aspergillus candidus]